MSSSPILWVSHGCGWRSLAEYNGFGWVASWTLLARLFSPLHMYHEEGHGAYDDVGDDLNDVATDHAMVSL